MLRHRYAQGSSALFCNRQARVGLQLRPLFYILSSWAACTLLFLGALHVLPSFLLAKGIALSERKVLRAEWNLPENALLFRVHRLGVGVGQQLKGRTRAPGGGGRGVVRWRKAEGWRGRPGAASLHPGAEGTSIQRQLCAEAQVSLGRSEPRRWQGAPWGAGRHRGALSTPGPFLLLLPVNRRKEHRHCQALGVGC